ncbi:MAG TPA: FAD-dependent oxidoreductase, partial [Pirellulales bacterium]|nr:FAD-dependent oxidoreductase [Pirellulales bacterium]
MAIGSQPVLILGAGINGCAVARELLLNGVSVWLVDCGDVASGATAGSSRLIHGGLRYLEYGEFDLVKESLAERSRLLSLAPQFVQPIRLWIPVASRLGGAVAAVGRFFSWPWWPQPQPRHGRGVWLIGAGLKFYDAYSRTSQLPAHKVLRANAPEAPAVDQSKYRWLCSYYDGQVPYAERLLVALLTDATEVARETGLEFRLFTYHQATLQGRSVEIVPTDAASVHGGNNKVEPAAIVNATGAWVDQTLARLDVPSRRLMGGTKGSHLFTFSPTLRAALAGQGIYAEASDGRPIFITPLADTILIGTTDEPFEGPPENALITTSEIEYLVRAVNMILPGARLTTADIDFHYSAVRPLPFVSSASPAAITRRHWLVQHDDGPVPLVSI